MNDLTAIQKKILSFLEEYFATNSISPTLRKIGDTLGYNSRAGVHYQIDMLEKAGELIRAKDGSIQLRKDILFTRIPVTKIPVYGIAKAGQPISDTDDSNDGFLEVDSKLIRNKGNLFAVRISGDSMNKAIVGETRMSLSDGNYAVVDKTAQDIDGKIVLAMVNGGATIKIYNLRDDSVVLSPYSSNGIHHPIYISDNNELLIRGKVVMALENPVIHPEFD